MPYATIAGQQLLYRLSCNDLTDRKSPLVLVHGAGGTHMHWPADLRRLPDWNVYAIDLPGHGKSAGPGRSSIADYRDVIYEFCRSQGLARIVLAGHSMGSAIAQDFALHYPGRLAGLVLVGAGARLRVAPAILDGIRADFAATAQLITEWTHDADAPEQLKRLFLRRMLANDPNVVYGDFLACNLFDVMGQLERISAPTLVLCGTEDRMTPPHYSEYLAANIPHARRVLVPGAGHMVMLEAAADVASAVSEFLHSLELGA